MMIALSLHAHQNAIFQAFKLSLLLLWLHVCINLSYFNIKDSCSLMFFRNLVSYTMVSRFCFLIYHHYSFGLKSNGSFFGCTYLNEFGAAKYLEAMLAGRVTNCFVPHMNMGLIIDATVG